MPNVYNNDATARLISAVRTGDVDVSAAKQAIADGADPNGMGVQQIGIIPRHEIELPALALTALRGESGTGIVDLLLQGGADATAAIAALDTAAQVMTGRQMPRKDAPGPDPHTRLKTAASFLARHSATQPTATP